MFMFKRKCRVRLSYNLEDEKYQMLIVLLILPFLYLLQVLDVDMAQFWIDWFFGLGNDHLKLLLYTVYLRFCYCLDFEYHKLYNR